MNSSYENAFWGELEKIAISSNMKYRAILSRFSKQMANPKTNAKAALSYLGDAETMLGSSRSLDNDVVAISQRAARKGQPITQRRIIGSILERYPKKHDPQLSEARRTIAKEVRKAYKGIIQRTRL